MRLRSSRWSTVTFALLTLSLPGSAQNAERHSAADEAEVVTNRQSGSVVKSLILPGTIEAWTPLAWKSSEPALVVASRMGMQQTAALELHLWTLEGERYWRRLDVEMPATLDALGSYGGDSYTSEPMILVFGDAKLRVLDLAGDVVAELEMQNGFYPVPTWGMLPGGDSSHIYRRLGALESLSFGLDRTTLESAWRVELPILVDRTSPDLRLRTPPVSDLGARDGSGATFAVGPQAVGLDRLRTLLIDVGNEATPETTEVWSRFSGPETVEESWYVRFDGAPAMLVTTVLADRHGVFEKKKLRLFILERDRSRYGSTPVLEVITRSRNWYRTCAGVGDIDGDDRDDILSAQPAGLGGGKLWFAVYLSRASGGLESKPVGTMLEVEVSEGCSLERDFDGDGQPDLLVSTGGELLIYTLGRRADLRESGFVTPSPAWKVALDDIGPMPEITDLYPGTTPQIVSSSATETGRGRLSVIRLE